MDATTSENKILNDQVASLESQVKGMNAIAAENVRLKAEIKDKDIVLTKIDELGEVVSKLKLEHEDTNSATIKTIFSKKVKRLLPSKK